MENSVKEKIENLINESEVMLFMKGTPEMPQCGFSAAVVGVLNHLGVNYKTSNVLQDEEIREGIKEYSDWPTIPQLYVKNEFVGGCDIIREMYENGELTSFFEEKNILTSKKYQLLRNVYGCKTYTNLCTLCTVRRRRGMFCTIFGATGQS